MTGIFTHGRDIQALRRDLDASAARHTDEAASTAARIGAIEEDLTRRRHEQDALARRLDETESAARDRLDALERRLAAQGEAIERLDATLQARDATIAALRVEVAKVERQAAIDLDEVRTTARALAGLLLRAEADSAP